MPIERSELNPDPNTLRFGLLKQGTTCAIYALNDRTDEWVTRQGQRFVDFLGHWQEGVRESLARLGALDIQQIRASVEHDLHTEFPDSVFVVRA